MNSHETPHSSLEAGQRKAVRVPAAFTGLGIQGLVDVKAMPRVLGRLTRLALRYPWRCAAALLAALGAAIFNLLTPRLLGDAVDQAHHVFAQPAAGEAAHSTLLGAALLIVGACTLRGVFTGLQGYLGENIANRVGHDMRLAFFDKLQQLSFSYHDRVHSGDLMARGMLDLEGIRGFLEAGLLRIVTLLMLVGLGSFGLLQSDLTLGLLALGFVPFVAWRAARMGMLMRLSWQRLQQLMADLTLSMEENLQGVRVVRAFASQKFEMRKFDAVSALALRVSKLRITVRMLSMSAMNLSHYVSMGLVLYVGGQRIAAGLMTVGKLTEFLTFIAILHQPLRQVGMVVNSSTRATGAGARLFDVLDAEPEIRDAPGARELRMGEGEGVLRFEQVDFRYPGAARNALTGISFTLRRGCTLGIVGAPGSGKSTLAQLLPRFYEASAGRITVDGADIREFTLASLRREIGIVQQEAFLFDNAAGANIAYADPDSTEDRIVDAASTAQLHTHLAGLRQGYGTRVGERGVALSGGQRQRMTIARGLLAEPSVLVFDDSTAAIDAATERQVRAALRDAVRDKAAIIIAHRLGAVMHADEIIVLEDGRIVERGTHVQLLQAGGIYASLWELQNREHGPQREAPVRNTVGEAA
jgi:ATP-binding cassette subfamily B protein